MNCFSVGTNGDPSVNPNVPHMIQVRLEVGVSITFLFRQDAIEGSTLIIATPDPMSPPDAWATLTDETGFEGSPHDLCSGPVEGTLRLDHLVKDASGRMTSVDGQAIVTFSNCTKQVLGVTDGTLKFDVQF